jgi:hypothetical protein
VRLECSGLAAVEAGLALGVQAPPAEPAAQVRAVDGVEPAECVDVLDAAADVERVVVLLGLLGAPLVGVLVLGVMNAFLWSETHESRKISPTSLSRCVLPGDRAPGF